MVVLDEPLDAGLAVQLAVLLAVLLVMQVVLRAQQRGPSNALEPPCVDLGSDLESGEV